MMMKLFLILILISMYGYAQSAEEIAKKAFLSISGYEGSEAVMTMILKNAKGVKNERKLKVVRKEGDSGDKSYIEFLYPNDIKGTKLLSYEVIGSDDKQWLFLPALKRIKRISSRNKSGSFVASEFSYEDISSVNYKNYTYNSVAKTVTKNGKIYFRIVRKPIDKHSGYSKQIIWIDKKNDLIRFGEYYDKHNKLLKKVHFSKYKKIEGIWRIFEIDIENVQNHKSSKLVCKKEVIHKNITNTDVSKRALQ
ncbi:outer membrane lipoprotein-sorting protein [Sulfurimonas sp.]